MAVLLRRELLVARVALLALGVAACGSTPPPSVASLPAQSSAAGGGRLKAVAFSDLPQWPGDTLTSVWPAFLSGCTALVGQSSVPPAWTAVCAAAQRVVGTDPRAVRSFFETQFTPYVLASADGNAVGLVTGYYEPLLHGSRNRSARYRYPIYAPPDDLLTVDLTALHPELKDRRLRGRLDGKRVVPYWNRAQIEAGMAPLAAKELFYVDDPVEAFFLHVQGSGRIQLAEGGMARVGYADTNGHAFRSIGRALVERGELSLDQASMQGIKQWGRAHPALLPALLQENPSYVFFRTVLPVPGASIDGPIGSLGVPLLAERTIAVDSHFVPLGAPVFLDTTVPLSAQPLRRVVIAQDTGSAIRGAVRADFFWGFGEGAAQQAGRMKQPGRMWLLWPKAATPPSE